MGLDVLPANLRSSAMVEIVFLADEDSDPVPHERLSPQYVEDGLVPRFVPLDRLARVEFQPPHRPARTDLMTAPPAGPLSLRRARRR